MDVGGDFKKAFKQRCHSPQCEREPYLHGSLIVRAIEHSDAVVLGEGHRKVFPAKYSEEEKFKPAKRQIRIMEHGPENNPRGKKYIPHPDNGKQEISHAERVHFDESNFNKNEYGGLPCSTWTRKRVVKLPNGIPVAKKESDNWGVESTMNRKQRISSSEQRRNNIGEASKGDKYYKEADREPGFYEKGGLVVGSTNTLKKSAKPTLRQTENGLNVSSGGKLEATYGKMQAKLAHQYDQYQVQTLTVYKRIDVSLH